MRASLIEFKRSNRNTVVSNNNKQDTHLLLHPKKKSQKKIELIFFVSLFGYQCGLACSKYIFLCYRSILSCRPVCFSLKNKESKIQFLYCFLSGMFAVCQFVGLTDWWKNKFFTKYSQGCLIYFFFQPGKKNILTAILLKLKPKKEETKDPENNFWFQR